MFVLALVTVAAAGCRETTEPEITTRPLPAPILGNTLFADLALGDYHSCGLTSGGEVYCWGSNSQGQSGNGLSAEEAIGAPMVVLGGYIFQSLTAGGAHTCGILVSGGSMCWGNNTVGQLGVGGSSTADQVLPAPVSGGHEFMMLSASTTAHTCGITTAGETWCWGENNYGRLGDGSEFNRSTPVLVSGNLQFASIAAGGAHTCALTADGTAYCWGLNLRGQVGDGTNINRLVPTAVATALKFTKIYAGLSHTCGLTDVNVAWCWGDNIGGALGDGTVVSKNTPVMVSGGEEFRTLALGERHGCGITVDGPTVCWGFNGFGGLGDGTYTTRLTPVAVSSPALFTKIAAGSYHTCGLTASGTTYCWGENGTHQLGAQ